MNVLILGSGGREHALYWLAKKSGKVQNLFCAPGNGGTFNVPLEISDHSQVIDFAKGNRIDLIIVGPEAPLAAGIVDDCRNAGLSIFGPTKSAAQLEASKYFAKYVMNQRGVPTAPARAFDKEEFDDAVLFVVKEHSLPLVVKADGLAAGKGALVCRTEKEALAAVTRCFVDEEFGKAGNKILVEDFLEGHPRLPRAEFSVLALVDIFGNFIMLPPAQDYKPIYDFDRGPNTGGMGAFAPVPWITEEMMNMVGEKIFKPVIGFMIDSIINFSGVLYAGLIWTIEGPKVVEFNVRFGDPELQPLAMLMDFDLIPVLKTIADLESISQFKPKWKSGAAVCVVMASNGYPGSYAKGGEISGMAKVGIINGVEIFQAGTRLEGEKIITNGGRVLGVTAHADNLLEAAEFAHNNASVITWVDTAGLGPYTRSDIGENVPSTLKT